MDVQKRLISSNFTRGGNKKLGVVIHTMVGTLAGTDSYFHNQSSQVSAHYGIDLDGSKVYQWVDESDQAWAQGIVSKPTFPLVTQRPGTNPNSFLISIECADNKDPHNADRSAQYGPLIELVKDICQRNNIPIDRDHICGHREIRSTKTCPGNIDVDYVVSQAAQNGGTMPGQLPDNYPQIIHKASQWDETVKKYLPDQRPEDASFDAIQRVVAGIQSQVSGLENKLKAQTEEMARRESEITNREEQVSRKEAQLLEQEKMKNDEIAALSENIKTLKKLKEQLESTLRAKQSELDTVYKDKGRIQNDLAVANARIKNYESGATQEKKDYVLSLIQELLERILGKKKGNNETSIS